MNKLMVDLLAPPQPYRHRVVKRPHIWKNQVRFACLCGWRSEWIDESDGWDAHPDHPDMLITWSRTDLRLVPHPSQVPA